jgi:hypothetical protein
LAAASHVVCGLVAISTTKAQPRRTSGVVRGSGTVNAHRRWLQRMVS